jgi:anti-sigma factor ChrR (cupin superfamily)
MNTLRRTCTDHLRIGLAAIPLLAGAQSAPPDERQAAAMISQRAPVIAADEKKWVPLPGIDGSDAGAVFGDPTKEAHRVFYKFPVGLKAPLHTHTGGDRGVIISGNLRPRGRGRADEEVGAGSYFTMAGGTKHVTTVEGDTPCVFYVEREGPFDVVMAEDAAAKKK